MIITEAEVLGLLIKGMTGLQIAKKLRVSLRTVEYRRKKLMERHKAKTAFQLGYRIKE